jgi:3-oxoacyl-[acyl-carrier-protein] synthase III
MKSIIIGSGSYIPAEIKTNRDFGAHDFYDENSVKIDRPPQEVAEKFKDITGIEERRYASCDMNASDIASFAALKALEDAKTNPETIDQIIVAHNFGNVQKHTIQGDAVPALASRVKHQLGIKNPNCVAYDILFGCPGWIQGVIQADAFFKAGIAQRVLIIGTETLSRVIDLYDRDCMIFSDGAGACVLEAQNNTESGILSTAVQCHTGEELSYLFMGKSNFPNSDPRIRYIKMKGRKIYEYAMKQVPLAMKECLDKASLHISEVKKIFLHQANEKMDEAITRSLLKLYGIRETPPCLMPMSIHKLGNSSVATIPTLYDLVIKGQMPEHSLEPGDIVLFASVGAGMNINAFAYRI